MPSTYSEHAEICAKFYALTLDSNSVSSFIFQVSQASSGEKALFVGGMFEVAAGLIRRGLDLTVIDYSDEMVAVGKKSLPKSAVYKGDISALAFNSEFDLIFVIGRVFTHMVSEKDLLAAIAGCRAALRPGGRLLVDNYEDSRIQVTPYFNGRVECRDKNCHIVRESKTYTITTCPYVIRWDAQYSGHSNGELFQFSDSIEHRAFSRSEFATKLAEGGFKVLKQGDNFDETSFYTLAKVS